MATWPRTSKTELKRSSRGTTPSRLAVNWAIDVGLKDFYAKQRLEAYEGVDVGRLVDDFDHYLAGLRDLTTKLQTLSPKNVKMTISAEVTKPVIVRDYHRVTLSEFPVGAVLRCRHLKRADGSIGGVELLSMLSITCSIKTTASRAKNLNHGRL